MRQHWMRPIETAFAETVIGLGSEQADIPDLAMPRLIQETLSRLFGTYQGVSTHNGEPCMSFVEQWIKPPLGGGTRQTWVPTRQFYWLVEWGERELAAATEQGTKPTDRV